MAASISQATKSKTQTYAIGKRSMQATWQHTMGTMPLASRLRRKCNACNTIRSGCMVCALQPTWSYSECTFNLSYIPSNRQHLQLLCSSLIGCDTGDGRNVPTTAESMQPGNNHTQSHYSRDVASKAQALRSLATRTTRVFRNTQCAQCHRTTKLSATVARDTISG